MNYIRKPDWRISENRVTDESVFLNRRALLASMGFMGAAAALPFDARAAMPEEPFTPKPPLNPGFADPGRPVTSEQINTTYNNFYEFGSSKRIYNEAQALETEGWTISVEGMVEEPFEIDVEDLISKVPVEERIYRHRCVEAWSMVVPWIGFEMSHLVKLARPLSSAKYVMMQTFLDPSVATEQRASWWPWPYTEGLTMEEANNELAFMVVGAYGKVLHKQFGAPIRLHTPWKYGFKSIKSIDRIVFTDERPVSFWEELLGDEYGFWANVNPEVNHPRWSQADERVLGTDDRIPTQLFNGYGAQVAHLYDGLEDTYGDRLWR